MQNSIDLKPIKVRSTEYECAQGIKTYADPPISGWMLHHTVKYSYRIYTYTVVAVTAVVTAVASVGGNAYIGGLAQMVGFIIVDHIPRVWYTSVWYNKWRQWPKPPWEIVAELNVNSHYANSSRTDYIGLTRSERWI